MAHTLDTSAAITASTANPVTKAYTCGAGATLLVLTIAVAGAVNRAGGSPTYNGVTLTQADITRKYVTSPEASAELWYLLAPPTGASYTLSIPNTGAYSIWGVISSYKARSGCVTVLDVAIGNSGLSANPSLAPSAAIAGDVMVEILGDGNASVATARTHTILGSQDWGQYVADAQYGLIATSGTVTAGFTQSSDDWGMVVALFKEVLTNSEVQLNIGDVWKQVDTTVAAALQINIGDVWKAVMGMKMNIGDIWKTIFWTFTISYYGTATALSLARQSLAGASVGNYALFGGGDQGSIGKNNVDAYDASLTRTTPTVLSAYRASLAAASVGNYALFGGGNPNASYSAVVDAYDTSLTRTIPTVLSVGRYYLGATPIGGYALFGGGSSSAYPFTLSAVVDAYNTSLTRSTPTVLSVARLAISAVTVGTHFALFGGGDSVGDGSGSPVVDAYDISLTRSIPTALSVGRQTPCTARVGSYALFGGGYGPTYSNVVDVYQDI